MREGELTSPGSRVRRDTLTGSERSAPGSDSGRVSRAETDLEHDHGNGKLTGRDKAVLGWLWTLALVTAMMNDQLHSKVSLGRLSGIYPLTFSPRLLTNPVT